jgi:glycerol uptake facilitator-like aquaporin
VAAGGTYPDPPAGNGRAFMMEVVLTAILVSVILGTATGWRSS